jgi:citrate synthase
MGFGHRVYRTRDPRADLLGSAAEALFQSAEARPFYDLARAVEDCAVRLLREYKPGRSLKTNVEFYTALLLHGVGLPTQLFTPVFASARVAGWTAHCLEQISANRLFRPQSEYIGGHDRRWVPMGERKPVAEDRR